MSEKPSPLGRLVLFAVILSVAGTLVAGLFSFAVDQPLRENVPPENGSPCVEACYDQEDTCIADGRISCMSNQNRWGNSDVLVCERNMEDACYAASKECIKACPME